MKDCELILGISGVACAIIKSSSDDEISLMSVIFCQLGDTLATYLTQKQICNSRLNSNDNSTDSNNKNNEDKNTNENNTNERNAEEKNNNKKNTDEKNVNEKNTDNKNSINKNTDEKNADGKNSKPVIDSQKDVEE